MRGPNVLQIVVDDLGAGDIGALNGGCTRTPAIDRLMDEGVRLAQHYAASPVCSPSRAALMTGRYPHRTGAVSVVETRGLDRMALRERTLADRLRAAGYATGLVGKWHNGALDPLHHPCSRGFDEFVGFRGGWSDYYDWTLEANGREVRGDGRYLTDVLTEEAISFLGRHQAAPFYLQLAYSAPHVPLQAPEEDVAPYRAAGDLSDEVATLYGMVTRLDRGIGAVLETLDALGLAESTMVVLVSDNGPQFAVGPPTSERRDLALQRFNLGWRGHKALVFEGGIRVPAVLRWPGGGLDGGRTVHAMTHCTDWVPTHLALAGLEPATGLPLDGVDMTPVLRGERAAYEGPRFWQWTMYDPVPTFNAAVRDGSWKLVRPAYAPEPLRFSAADWAINECYARAGRPPEETPPPPRFELDPPPAPYLFDLDADPVESTDLAAARPDVVGRLEGALDRWFDEVEAERLAASAAGGS